jgi:hypothetical protein
VVVEALFVHTSVTRTSHACRIKLRLVDYYYYVMICHASDNNLTTTALNKQHSQPGAVHREERTIVVP